MLLYVVRNEEVQKKLQKEIDMEIGSLREPTLSDRTRYNKLLLERKDICVITQDPRAPRPTSF